MIENVDINFDGKQDLLIHEGSSGGSGGSWSNYRAVVWNEKKRQFEYYLSFPEQLVSGYELLAGILTNHFEQFSISVIIQNRTKVLESKFKYGKILTKRRCRKYK